MTGQVAEWSSHHHGIAVRPQLTFVKQLGTGFVPPVATPFSTPWHRKYWSPHAVSAFRTVTLSNTSPCIGLVELAIITPVLPVAPSMTTLCRVMLRYDPLAGTLHFARCQNGQQILHGCAAQRLGLSDCCAGPIQMAN